MDNLLFQPPPRPSHHCGDHGGIEDAERLGNFTFKTPDTAVQVAKILGEEKIDIDPIFADRKTTLKAAKDGRLVMEIERKKGDAALKKSRPAGSPEDEVGSRLRDHDQRREGRRSWADRTRQPYSSHQDAGKAVCRLGGPRGRRVGRASWNQREDAVAEQGF